MYISLEFYPVVVLYHIYVPFCWGLLLFKSTVEMLGREMGREIKRKEKGKTYIYYLMLLFFF